MGYPSGYKYSKDHEWVSVDDDTGVVTIGITDYAVEHLGDIVHIEFPEVDDLISVDSSFGTIESTKTVADCYMPMEGKVLEVNYSLLKNLDILVEDPYDEGWLIKIEPNSENTDHLMNSEEYEAYISELDE